MSWRGLNHEYRSLKCCFYVAIFFETKHVSKLQMLIGFGIFLAFWKLFCLKNKHFFFSGKTQHDATFIYCNMMLCSITICFFIREDVLVYMLRLLCARSAVTHSTKQHVRSVLYLLMKDMSLWLFFTKMLSMTGVREKGGFQGQTDSCQLCKLFVLVQQQQGKTESKKRIMRTPLRILHILQSMKSCVISLTQ